MNSTSLYQILLNTDFKQSSFFPKPLHPLFGGNESSWSKFRILSDRLRGLLKNPITLESFEVLDQQIQTKYDDALQAMWSSLREGLIENPNIEVLPNLRV